MRILIVDDHEYNLQNVPLGKGENVVEIMKVSFDRNDSPAVNEQIAHDAIEKILSFEPNIIFLDHYPDGDFPDEYLPDGEWFASWLRVGGYRGKIISTSSEKQSYSDGQSRKVRGMSLEELLSHV